MKQMLLSATIIIGVGLTACTNQNNSTSQKQKLDTMEISNEQKVIALLKSFETGSTEPLAYISADKYIQHNLTAPDGLEGFKSLLEMLKGKGAKVNTVRAFRDGDYVFTHTDYNLFGSKVGFDVFRFEAGKMVEHWDNLQETPATTNPSGHTMIDGPVKAKDLDKTEANKILIKSFIEDVLINGKYEKMAGYFDGDNYIQHNAQVPDKVSGLKGVVVEMAKQGIVFKYDKIHKVLGEGDFVLVLSEGYIGDSHNSFYDLYRVENGKIAEHWDVVAQIPAEDSWKNNNGKF